MRKGLSSMFYSFPVQLLLLHLKRNHFLILFWLFFAALTTGFIGERYGVNLLFLDPEYLGKVNFTSYLLLGIAFGGFIVVWNMTSYILNAHYFPFLATLKRPFGVYCLNNSALPVFFSIMYIYILVDFQSYGSALSLGELSLRICGFMTGLTGMLILSMVYFFRTNKDIFQIVGIIKKKRPESLQLDPEEPTQKELGIRSRVHTEYFLTHTLRWRHTRSTDHYPASVIRSVYKQHHANALFIEMTSIGIVIILGIFMDHRVVRIPAGASLLLLFAIFVVLVGAFTYWLGRWKIFFLVLIIVVVNALMRSNILSYRNKVFGLDYSQHAPYTLDVLDSISNSAKANADKKNMLHILETWKEKNRVSGGKPRIVFINCSGGGLRASYFVFSVLQQADSITHHNMMEHCPLITGASGGMLAAAYYRELYSRNIHGDSLDLFADAYAQNMSSDILNAVGFTVVVNDLFYPWQRYRYGGFTYRKDRGYMFEKVLNENTEGVLQKNLGDYTADEKAMRIPMMLFYPSIINDERKLFIGTQSFSFLSKPQDRMQQFTQPEVGGADIHYLLADAQVDSIAFTSVLRMNCTFPYILPNVSLPTTPQIEVMDAGIRDNFGIQTSGAFIAEFADWITANTSGVIVLNIRALEQEKAIRAGDAKGIFDKYAGPVENLYTNWVEIQDYQNEQLLSDLNKILENKMEVITIEYKPGRDSKQASLSLHLTNREKKDIADAVHNAYNNEAYARLQFLLSQK